MLSCAQLCNTPQIWLVGVLVSALVCYLAPHLSKFLFAKKTTNWFLTDQAVCFINNFHTLIALLIAPKNLTGWDLDYIFWQLNHALNITSLLTSYCISRRINITHLCLTIHYLIKIVLWLAVICDLWLVLFLRCVLQWTWRSANSWGNCANGTAGLISDSFEWYQKE